MSDEEFYARLDRAIEIATEHEAELLAYPDVVAVGAGPERKAGKLTGEPAIIVTVRRKRTMEELEAVDERPLPSKLDDVPVDVIELGVSVEAPEIVEAQARAREVLERVREEWLAQPNVTGIGVGYKRRGGERNVNQIALQVFVEKKLAPDELDKRKLPPVPPEIDGVVTDVEEQARLRPSSSASGSRDDRRDPLVGGLTVGVNTKPFWYGTLGALVFDRTTGEGMVLSNQHVLDGNPGVEVVQPSPIGLDDSLEFGFQLDFCNPLHFFRLDTPNTTVGSVLAGAAAAAVVAAALSDEIDPTRRGQEATVPPPGARTLTESHEVKLGYSEMPIPGTHFKLNTGWRYTRHTDAGDQSTTADEERRNPHALADKLLLTDRALYHPGHTIRLFGLILPEECAPEHDEPDVGEPISSDEIDAIRKLAAVRQPPLSAAVAAARTGTADGPSTQAAVVSYRCHCERYHPTAILTPTSVDRAFPIVLREPVVRLRGDLLQELLQLVEEAEDSKLQERVYRFLRYGCFYYGELAVENIPTGPWRHYLFVQTVNTATAGMKPTEAAQIIGGLPVSQNTTPQLDLACGPVVYEDGQFDIELL
jgi:hypothetical protein